MHGRGLRSALGRLFVVAVVLVCASGAAGYAKDQIRAWRSYFELNSGLQALAQCVPTGTMTEVVFPVPYRGAVFSLSVPADSAYLAAARRVNGSALFGRNRLVRQAALRAVLAEQRGDPFVSAMAERLGWLRAQLHLSDDDFVDLVARAVQAIPYGQLHESTFLPVVTIAGDTGVCADKSLLLAVLLEREGYDSGVFIFPSQAHVAVAVRGRGPGLNGTGYTLIETTRLSYVGEVDRSLRAAGPVFQPPQLVVLGGERRYGRDLQTEFIADTLERTRSRTSSETSVPVALGDTSEPAEKGTSFALRTLSGNRLAAWIDAHRDWPEATYAALVASGPNH